MEQCLTTLTGEAKDLRVLRAVLGLGYHAVQLENGSVGLSANILRGRRGNCTVFNAAGTVRGSRVGDLLDLHVRGDLLTRSLCLAAFNALVNIEGSGDEGDVFDRIDVKEGDRVAMVGLIEPVAAMLKRKGCEVRVYEERTVEHPLVDDPATMAERCGEADLIIVTATSLINDTFDEIMGHAANAREVVLMGPSTPLSGEAFAATPVTCLAGSRVIDPDAAFTIVMEGGGTQALFRRGAMVKIVRKV